MKRSLNVSDRKKLAKGSCSNDVGRSSGIDDVVFSCDGRLCSLDIEDGFSCILSTRLLAWGISF